ncbi:BTAD domain-containing putative transcriptional regulator [Kitasatospora sp. NPDC059577]|uniref:AfsR/SARP family transcriptional regulator n=1 Tax=Kitasatospora sp. NPDC059577 TaxID=3346873 RepID=UPI003674016F
MAGARRRAVLALLASELNHPVPVERLLDTVWDGAPPPTARAALQGHVSAVRRGLGEGLCLLTRPEGYVLVGKPELVDATRFERLTAGAEEAADAERAVGLLREALDLWDGPALTDCGSRTLTETTGRRLDTARVLAAEALAERLLALGRGAQALPDLQAVVTADPLRGSAAALLTRCLHQAGRAADARLAHERARTRLAAHGLTPGPLLRAAGTALGHTENGTAAPAAVAPIGGAPAAVTPTAVARTGGALPRMNVGLVGRAAELRQLDDATLRAEGRPVLVTGVAGAGKSSLVLHWAHTHADRFPDGRIHLNLRGFGEEEPLTPAEALAAVLGWLGVPAAEVPGEPAQAAALFRALTEGRRLLLVLDGARSAEQVEPLLPAAPEPVVVVTSRSRLTDLVVREAAIPLPVAGLPEEEAVELLGRVAGPERIAAEPGAARRLAALCDRLPLALRVAGARLASRPAWSLTDLAEEMSDQRTGLAALATGGALGMATALGRSVRVLPEEARRLFALSGLHPGETLDSGDAAALTGASPARARELLAELDAAHLVLEALPGLFQVDRLARLYAVELAAELPCPERVAATRRLLDHVVNAAGEALKCVTGVVPAQGVSARALQTAEQALELARRLVGELVRQVPEPTAPEQAADSGRARLVDRLSRTLDGYREERPGNGRGDRPGAPEGAGSERTSGEPAVPERAAPERAVAVGTVPAGTAADHAAPDRLERLLDELVRGAPVEPRAARPEGSHPRPAADARTAPPPAGPGEPAPAPTEAERGRTTGPEPHAGRAVDGPPGGSPTR